MSSAPPPSASQGEDELVAVALTLGDPAAVDGTMGDGAAPALASLASIATQTHRCLELLVAAPDGEAQLDRAVEALSPWLGTNAGRFARVEVLRTPAVYGTAAQRNAAFAATQARAVMVLDTGSVLLPAAVARLWAVLDRSGAACAYSQQLLADGGIGTADVWRRDALLTGDPIGPTSLVRRDAWAAVGGYALVDGGWETYDLWCKFLEAGLGGVYVPELLWRDKGRNRSRPATQLNDERQRLVQGMLTRHPWLGLVL